MTPNIHMEKEIIEFCIKDIDQELDNIILKALSEPYYVAFKGLAIGKLKLSGSELFFTPNKRFEPYSKPIHDMLGAVGFKERVKYACSWVIEFKKAHVKNGVAIIEIQDSVFNALMGWTNIDWVKSQINVYFDSNVVLKIMDGNDIIKTIKI